jgi:hypothetical protein
MVLLDSTSPNGSAQLPSSDTGSYNLAGRFAALLPAAAHLGLARLVGGDSYGSLPAQSRDEARASAATAGYVKSFLDELRESPMAMRQAASLVDFDAKPLIVVTARHEGHSRCCHVGSDLKPPELARRFSSGSVRVPGRGSPGDLHVVPSRRCGRSRSWVVQPKIVRRDPLAAEPPSTARRTRRSVAKQPPAARRPA